MRRTGSEGDAPRSWVERDAGVVWHGFTQMAAYGAAWLAETGSGWSSPRGRTPS